MGRLFCLDSTGFGCPVFGLEQLKRGVEYRQYKRARLSDLRASGSLEQDADFVFLLYRDEYYNPETTDRGIGEIIV
ncbi:MAG: DnaB-like helicase C-terminal domain-containing protein, partial [Dolichospermum sp.]